MLCNVWEITALTKPLPAAYGVCQHSRDVLCLQVGTYALFVGEVYAWYCVGEIVGRGFSVAGYNV